jgi:hypothetical protein
MLINFIKIIFKLLYKRENLEKNDPIINIMNLRTCPKRVE